VGLGAFEGEAHDSQGSTALAEPLSVRSGTFGALLGQYAQSIDEANNLRLSDFRCRFLVSEDIWIPLGELLLIEQFRPVWNVLIEGF
jgi:hypothetical protein